jgi:penicillin-binding protein 1C
MRKLSRVHTTSKYAAQPEQSMFWKSLSIFIGSAVLMIAVFGGSIAGLFAYFAQDLPQVVNVDDRQLSQSTKIYDRTGDTLLYKISGEKTRTVVEKDEISPIVRKAFMAAEDDQFYEHWGIQPRAIARAALVNIREGQTVQGGSTITQQFVKNALLTDDRTYVRKLKEAILSVQLELRYSKDEIFTMYLNEIPFGSNIAGVEAAAQTYFDKPADEVNAHEAATLATIPRAPSYYSPYGSNRDALRNRQEDTLKRMKNQGFITEGRLQQSLAKEINVAAFDQNIKAPHFVFHVRDVLREKLGSERLQQGGLHVRTSLNYDLQQKAKKIVKDHVQEEVEAYGGNNGALAAVDPANGQILTLVGSRDYYNEEFDGEVNIMTSLQSPGSSMKPFVYASAFEKGYNPQTRLFDLPTDFGNYTPENFDGQYRGPVNISTAITRSLNIPAVKALHLTGMGDFFSLARNLGIENYTSETMRRSKLSAAIGGANLRPLEEVGAYATLADGGKHDPITPIVFVENNEKEKLEEFEEDNKQEDQVLERQAALQITEVLSEGSPVPSSMRIDGVDVASKTGTSQNFRDSLTMGYTTNLAAGVWTGNNSNDPMANGAYGSDVAAPMWKDFMTTALETIDDTSPGEFQEPKPVKTDKPMLGGDHVFDETVKINRITGKRANEHTPPGLVRERTYKQVHSILYYVNKKNPLGPIPRNPEYDPQYKHWEPPVQNWAQDQDFSLGTPPRETDNEYQDTNDPSVSITNRSDGFNIDGNQNSTFKIKTSVSAKEDIEKVEFLIDGSVTKTVNSSSFNANLQTPGKGAHTLTVRAYDTILDRNEVTFNFNVDKDESSPRIIKFKAQGGPKKYNLMAKVRDSGSGLQRVEFWENNQDKKLATRSVSGSGPTKASYTYNPDTPKPPYEFYVKVFDEARNKSTSDSLKRPDT